MAFLHDDPLREVLWEGGVEGFFQNLLDRLESGDVAWRAHLGWMTSGELAAIDAYEASVRNRQEPAADLSRLPWVVLFLVAILGAAAFAVLR